MLFFASEIAHRGLNKDNKRELHFFLKIPRSQLFGLKMEQIGKLVAEITVPIELCRRFI